MGLTILIGVFAPIIFGLIAWLSNYFSKKKKPTEQTEIEKKKSNESLPNELKELYNKIKKKSDINKTNEENKNNKSNQLFW